MFYVATYDNSKGLEDGALYDHNSVGYRLFHEDVFSPDTEILTIVDFRLHGKNYGEIKANLEETAKEWQRASSEHTVYYGIVSEVQAWLEKYGKKYGLIKEFRENCIC